MRFSLLQIHMLQTKMLQTHSLLKLNKFLCQEYRSRWLMWTYLSLVIFKLIIQKVWATALLLSNQMAIRHTRQCKTLIAQKISPLARQLSWCKMLAWVASKATSFLIMNLMVVRLINVVHKSMLLKLKSKAIST